MSIFVIKNIESTMQYLHLEEVDSTNSYLLRELANGNDISEGTVIFTTKQTQGRGQIGNKWEAEPYKNISFSLALCPSFLPIAEQFIISEIASISVVEVLNKYLHRFSIKWPNDIYFGDHKIAGMLIENQLLGTHIAYSIIGIGININQIKFVGDAPNPVSLLTLLRERGNGINELPIIPILEDTATTIWKYYIGLKENMSEYSNTIHSKYFKNLYRAKGFHPFVETDSGEQFMAKIDNIEPTGAIVLQTNKGERRRYMFKEVKWVISNKLTKE